jgi:hypothetical protein
MIRAEAIGCGASGLQQANWSVQVLPGRSGALYFSLFNEDDL